MANGNITNKDIYEKLNSMRREIMIEIKDVRVEVSENTNFRNQLIGKMTVIFTVIGFGANYVVSLFFRNK